MGERHLLSVVESFSEARQSRGLKMFWWNYNEGDEITPSKVMKLQQKWWNYTKGDEVITKVMKLQQSQRWWSYNEDDDYAWWENLRVEMLMQDYAQWWSTPCEHSCYTNIFNIFEWFQNLCQNNLLISTFLLKCAQLLSDLVIIVQKERLSDSSSAKYEDIYWHIDRKDDRRAQESENGSSL